MAKRIGYMFLDKQLTLVLDGNPYEIDPGHPKFKEIVSRMQRPESETEHEEAARCEALYGLVHADRLDLREAAAAVGIDDVTIEHGVVQVKGKAIHNSLTKRILELKSAGLPYTGFIRFLVNLEQNPRKESREALFDFLEQGRFPLTEDGCFLGYKGVRKGTLTDKDGKEYETLVDCHSGSYDMAPGNKHSMPWNAVDDNRNEACGAGFHVGTLGHARGYGDTMIVVKVNPKDCVSVPLYDRSKLRCCAYEVVNIYADKATAREFIKPVYSEDEVTDKDFEEAEEEEFKLRQPSAEERRAEFVAMNRDDICREAARRGIFASTNEARWLGKDLVVEALMLNDVPFEHMSRDLIAELAVRRGLYISTRSALKAGRDDMMTGIRQDNEARQAELESPQDD
jgi:hypothetical protein